MAKTRKRKKSSQKPKENSCPAEDSENEKASVASDSESQNQRDTLLLQLAANPRFVGAMRFMLRGCLACGTFFAILFFYPDFGRFFEQILYAVASPVPKNFIPPNTYVPGMLTPPILLLLIAAFTIYGYKKGATPPEIKKSKDDRSRGEKIFEFIFIFVACLIVIYFRFREDHPEYGFRAMISHPIIIGMLIIISVGVPFYVFSRQQSTQYLFFVLNSAVAVGFVLFLAGLVAHTIIGAFLYALNH